MNTVVHFQKKLDRRSQFCLGTAFVAFTLSLHGCDLFQGESDSANDGSLATNDQLSDLASIVTDINNEQDVYHAATELSFACGLSTTCESRSQLSLDVQSVHDDVGAQAEKIVALETEVGTFADEAEKVIDAAELAQSDARDAKSDAEKANTEAVEAKGQAEDALSAAILAKGLAATNETDIGEAHGRLNGFDDEYSPRLTQAERDITDTNNVLGNDWSTLWGDKSVADVIGVPNDLFTRNDDGTTINGILEGHHTAIGYDNWISWFNGVSIAGVIGQVPQGGAPKFAYSDTITGAIGTTEFPTEHIGGEKTITNAIAKLSEKVKDLEEQDGELLEEFQVLDRFVQKESFMNSASTLFDWLTDEFNKYTTLTDFNVLDDFVNKDDFEDKDGNRIGTLQEYLKIKFEDYVETNTFAILDGFVKRSDFSTDTLKVYTDATYAPKSAVDILSDVVGNGELPFQNDGEGTKPNTIVDVIGTIPWNTTDLGSTLSDAINYLANAVKANEGAALQEVDDVARNIVDEGSVAEAIATSISDPVSIIRSGLDDNFAPISINETLEDIEGNVSQQLASHVNINEAASPQVNNFYILHGLRAGQLQKFYSWARTCNTEVISGGAELPTSCEFVVVAAHPEFQYDRADFTFEPFGQPDSDFFTSNDLVTVEVDGAVTVLTVPYFKIVREAVTPAAAMAIYLNSDL